MRKIILLGFLCIFVASVKAQNKYPTYCDVYLFGERGFGKNAIVTFDFGFDRNVDLLDEDGKKIKFPSAIAAINYLAKKGWKLFSVVNSTNTDQIILMEKMTTLKNALMVMHYILTKDITSENEILDGLKVSKFKTKADYREKKMSDDGYYY